MGFRWFYGDPTNGINPANTPNDQLFFQGSGGINGAPAPGDGFGAALSRSRG